MTAGEKKKTQIKKFLYTIRGFLVRKPENRHYFVFRMVLLCVAAFLICSNWYVTDRKNNYRIGYPSSKTYFALTTARYEDRAATLELRQRAAMRIVDVMVQDEKVAQEVNKRLDNLRNKNYSLLMGKSLFELFVRLSENSQRRIVLEVIEIGEKVRDEAKTKENQTSLIWKYLKGTTLSQAERNVAFQILDIVLNPTLHSDVEMTERLRDDVSSHIPAVVREVRPGSVLVSKGQIITPSLAKLLASQGYPDAAFPIKQLVFILLIVAVWSFWPIWIENGLREKLSHMEWVYIAVILSLAWTLELFFARFLGYSMAVLGLTGWLCLTLPVSLSYHIIFGGGIISVMIAYGTNPGILILGCVLASFSASIGRMMFNDPPNDRIAIWKNLFFLGLCLGVVSVGIHWGLGLYFTHWLIISSLIFSAFWGALVVALLPLWENLFDVISPLRLLELSHPSQHLIKRMQMEAPGTYHHTLMVGTIAEAAADCLKMNGLLVRAGAYYHDIGKLKHPQYFVENQVRGINPHDSILPSLSGLVLISHVKDGLEIAEENKLPKTLRRFIAEHHGTTLQKYFYEKALAMGEDVTEDQFRYPGPKPKSRETALVMLADSAEAAVKAVNKPFKSIKELRILIDSVVQSKMDAGQLDDIDFTLSDMTAIKASFVEILRSTYHSREVRDIKELVEEKANLESKKNVEEKAYECTNIF